MATVVWMVGLVWIGLDWMVGLLFFSGITVYIAQFTEILIFALYLNCRAHTHTHTAFHNNRHNLHVAIRPHRIFDKNRIASKI